MKNILLIGVGGTGSHAVDILYSKIHELGNLTNNHISAIVFDTDEGSIQKIKDAVPISMTDESSVGAICDRIGRRFIREWFPCDDKAVCAQELSRGASQWRKKSYLAFLNLMNKPQTRSAFISALEEMCQDPSATCEVYVIASIAGGTGSGSFIPIALYARRYLRKQLGKNPIVNAMVALPDIYASAQNEDNKIKVYANAYAILRELNAIYLVTRNFNEGNRTNLKNAPVKLRIGNPEEPNVGVLFDASDKQFWTPEAAPFTQIFVLDRIPKLGIEAHDIVLANSIYTLICTDIGTMFDSEASNHEILRSQNNGSNAIYASVSTSQLVFPVESILDYLAHKKALSACEGEWLVLHRAVEKRMQEKEREEEDRGRKYIANDGEYADLLLKALEDEKDENADSGVCDLVKRSTVVYDKDGKESDQNLADQYYNALVSEIEERIKPIQGDGSELIVQNKNSDNREDRLTKANFYENTANIRENITAYNRECLAEIAKSERSLLQSILSYDKDKDILAPRKCSIVDGLLKNDGKFIHPVAAMVQLCRLRVLLKNINNDEGEEGEVFREWEELRSREKDKERIELYVLDDDQLKKSEKSFNEDKSAYANCGGDERKNRFYIFISDESGSAYDSGRKRTKVLEDADILENDAKYIADKIYTESLKQLKGRIAKRLMKRIDVLIEKYKTFFSRFEKAKSDLVESCKTALNSDSRDDGSVLNIYSTPDNKKSIMDQVFKSSGPVSMTELKNTDDLVGLSVFKSVYKAALESYNNTEYDDKDVGVYKSLFDSMISAYREFIRKTDSFKVIASYNIVEALEAACRENNVPRDVAFARYFSKLQSFATPKLKVDLNENLGDLIMPSKVTVYMISEETARYIKKHAAEYDLHLPQGQNREESLVEACASQFIQKYSGNEDARVAIVKNVSDAVLYCTGEIMDITPLRIPKFNELSSEGDNLYYVNYVRAIKNYRLYSTDMWNPHIGKDLFLRDYLPYLNPKMDANEDNKMIKALIYGLTSGKLIYTKGRGDYQRERCFRYVSNGVVGAIRCEDNSYVTLHNLVQLVNWLRRQDLLVEDWSDEFDADIKNQMDKLPNVTTEVQIDQLEAKLTNSPFMGYFRDKLFVDKDNEGAKIGLLEFAYILKISEESTRDCDYADRMLITCYDIFKQMIAYRINPASQPEWYIRVYKQQLDNIFSALAESKTVKEADPGCEEVLKQIIGWCESRKTFVSLPDLEETGLPAGQFSLDRPEFAKTKATIDNVKKRAKEKKATKKNAGGDETDNVSDDEADDLSASAPEEGPTGAKEQKPAKGRKSK